MEAAAKGVGLEELLGKSGGLTKQHEDLLGAIGTLFHPSVRDLGKALDCDVNVIKRGIRELEARSLVRERMGDGITGNYFYVVKEGQAVQEVTAKGSAQEPTKVPESFPCPKCPKILPTKVGRSIHMATIHKVHNEEPAGKEKTWPCPKCGRPFSSETGVNIHIGQMHKEDAEELQDDEEPAGDPLLMKLKRIVDELQTKGYRVKVLIEVHYGNFVAQGAS